MIKLAADVGKALALLRRTRKRAGKALAASALHAANLVRKNARALMPRASGPRDHSRPGEPPKRHRGRLAASLRAEPSGHRGAVVGSRYFVARMMEDGTDRMKPRPFIARATERSMDRIRVFTRTEINRAASKE